VEGTIIWKRDFSGWEVEALCNGEPLPALPRSEQGALSCRTEEWSYKKGDRTLVKIQDRSGQGLFTFIDLENRRAISGIPRDAFEFVG
jgi:hypothetical protein